MEKIPVKRGLPAMHPGELLREDLLPALGKPKSEIASLLGISRQTLYDIVNEKQPVTAPMALRLGKLCGNGPNLWLNLQKRYDLERAEREVDISAIPTLEAVLSRRIIQSD
jgi:addiction module HigA family antidote